MTPDSILTLDALHALAEQRLNPLFQSLIQNIPALPLRESMNYALSHGGKRLRPLLVYATAPLFNTPLESLDGAAAAVEIIHTYSLIHDDLPSMDNADLRRGKPTCHKVFGEGMAVLTGDALQTLAIDALLNHSAPLSAESRLQMLASLSRASGAFGMASGQALDITLLSDPDLTLPLLEQIYRLKTGELLSVCLTLGWLASKDRDDAHHTALTEFSDAMGLAFQIQDDILDVEAESAATGKTQGIDNMNNKNTYPKLAGMNEAKLRVEALYEHAMEALNYFGPKAQLLRNLTNQLLFRKK